MSRGIVNVVQRAIQVSTNCLVRRGFNVTVETSGRKPRLLATGNFGSGQNGSIIFEKKKEAALREIRADRRTNGVTNNDIIFSS